MAATYDQDASLLNHKLQIMVLGGPAGKTANVNIKDVCNDGDCSNCCRDNTGNKAWKLIDIEKAPGSALLGFSTSSPTFDINSVSYPTQKGLRPGAASGVMALCYKDLGAADQIP